MNKKQLFNLIVEKCASVCNVSAESIKGVSRKADVVDARCMAFRFAIQECGFTPRDIASLLGKVNPKAIRTLFQTYETRCRSFCFRELASYLRAELTRLGILSTRKQNG